ncbi:MAG TPA: tetratricopeptide repeat protein [Syntrophales bacterium]|nr:tetratricopeptide repeat protein [Syntrophales bacterium]
MDDLLNIGGIKVAPHALEELISKNVKVKDVGICTTLTPDGIEGLCVAISTDEVLDMGLVEEIGRCFGNQCGKIRFMRVDSIPRTDTGKIQRALLKDAFASYRRAIEIKPDYADAHNNLGNTLRDLGRLVEAEASYRRALEIKPDYADAKYNKSLLLLLLGCFEEGWEKYEWRWRRKESPGMPDFGRPLWLGETSIQGKCVQLWGEQGVGDSIQFLRYTPRVANLAAEVFVRLPSTLTELVQRSFKSVKVLAERGLPVEFDYHCPLMSLALAFRTFSESDIPSDVPYLTPDPEKQSKWRKRLEKDDKLLVGIAWRGNPQHKNDRNRSIPFELLRGLLEIDQIRWVILQKPLENKEVLQLKQLAHCVMVSDELIDFDETAAATAELDLMISVDTAVAHHKRKSSSRRSMRKY